MFVFRSGKWRWRFVSKAAAEEVGDPLDMADARVVHEVCESRFSRRVLRRDGFFFKEETRLGSAFADRLAMRFFPRTAAEFDSILLLQRHGIGVVEPVGCGSDDEKSILITRDAGNSITVAERLRRFEASGELPPEEFLIGWSDVAAGFFRSGIYFPDFHPGNVLWGEDSRGFMVVDPLGARRSFADHTNRRFKMIRRQFGAFFGGVGKPTVLKMLSAMLPGMRPEELYRALLLHSAAYIRAHALGKRRGLERFRRGEYTRCRDGIEYRLDDGGEPLTLDFAEPLELPPERAAVLWERDYLGSLFHLPLLRIVAREVRSGTLYRRTASPGVPPEEVRRDLLERVELAGFDPREFACRFDRRGRGVLEDCGPLG